MTVENALHIVRPVKRLLLTPLTLLATPAFAGLLYEPASGQLPDGYLLNPWTYGQATLAGAINNTVTSPIAASVTGGLLSFDTTGGLVRGGWNTTGNTLDRATGYTLGFELKVNSESHASNDRSGFSVIVISSDLQGVELGFWGDEIWAQNAGFTHGEGSSGFNPSSAVVAYALTVQGSAYTLTANTVPILTGSLRAYGTAPYTTPNFLFLGDNTFSASADSTLGNVTFTAVPEPGEWAAITSLGALGFAAVRRWRQGRAS